MSNDIDIKQDVIDELEFEPSVDAEGIGVMVDDGVVTLCGHVPLFYQRTKAEEAVWRVSGVRGLVQEMEVEQAGALRSNDEDLARRVLERLDDTVTVPDSAIRVKVQNGWVQLQGEVGWNWQRCAAVEAVESLKGVEGLINQITLSPNNVAHDIEERIQRALHRHADIEAGRVEVKIDNGTVTLSGTVDSGRERGEIRRAAWSTPGVVEVIDNLTI